MLICFKSRIKELGSIETAIISGSINEESGILKETAAEIKELVVPSEGTAGVDVKNVVVAADAISKELLEYVSAGKALEEGILAI